MRRRQAQRQQAAAERQHGAQESAASDVEQRAEREPVAVAEEAIRLERQARQAETHAAPIDPKETRLLPGNGTGAEPAARLRKATARAEEAVNVRARSERLEALGSKADALREKEKELVASAEARRLGDAASRTKAQRKSA